MFSVNFWQQTPWWTLLWLTLWCCLLGTSWTGPSSCATCLTPPPTRSTGSRSRRACWSQVTRFTRVFVVGNSFLGYVAGNEQRLNYQMKLMRCRCVSFFLPFVIFSSVPELKERIHAWMREKQTGRPGWGPHANISWPAAMIKGSITFIVSLPMTSTATTKDFHYRKKETWFDFFFFFFILFAFTLFDWNDYRGSKSKYNKVNSFMFFSWVCEYIHINQIIYIYLTRISWCHENSFHNQNIYRLFFSFFCFISKYSLSFELITWFTAECSRYVTSSLSVKN